MMSRCELSTGAQLHGRYTVLSLLGQGGFAFTYLARDMAENRLVAIKEFFWTEELARDSSVSNEVTRLDGLESDKLDAALARFVFEGEILSVLDGAPFVARVLDTFRENGTAYIVMEYIAGRTLRQLLKDGPMDAELAVRSFLPILDALSVIHAKGILHLDIRPENLISMDGLLYLVDFGGARSFEKRGQSQYGPMTKGAYSPPEVFEEGDIGPWSDIFSVCAVLYEAVTGKPPESAVQRLFYDRLVPPSQLRQGLDSRLDDVLIRGLQLDQGRRFGDAASLSLALSSALTPAKPRRRRPYYLAGAAALLCLCFGIFKYVSAASQPFYGVDTTQLLFRRDYRTSDEEWEVQTELLSACVSELAGDSPSLVESDDSELKALLPEAVFGGRSIDEVLELAFADAVSVSRVSILHEQTVIWQQPGDAAYPGERQCAPEELDGATILGVLLPTESSEKDESRFLRAEVALKSRLDALDVPYAFGQAQGEDDSFAVLLPEKDWSLDVLLTLGNSSIYVSGSDEADYILLSLYDQNVEFDSAAPALKVTAENEEQAGKIRDFTESVLEKGSGKLLFSTSSWQFPWLETGISAPVTDGRLEFSPVEAAGDDGRALANYIYACAASYDALPDDFGLSAWETASDGELTGLYAVRGPTPELAPDPAQLQTLEEFEDYMSLRYYIQTVDFDQLLYVFPSFDATESETVEFIGFVQSLLAEVNHEVFSKPVMIVANWDFFAYNSYSDKADCRISILPHEGQLSVTLHCSGSEAEAWLPALEEAWAEADFGDSVYKFPEIQI